MDVTVLRATERPERLVCQAARGDYFDGYVGDTEYAELMESVDYSDKYTNEETVIEAKTRSFIEKQLSRCHYGPWEHPQITFSVKGVSRVTMAQITRHRHMTFDVQSQRYVDFSDTDSIVPKSLRDSDHFSRETGPTDLDEDDLSHWRNAYKQMTAEQLEYYEDMVDAGVPKEDARFILPLGTPVNMTFSGNARTFMHVFNLRQKASAQWEVRELCDMMAEHLKEWASYTFNWYEQNKPHKIGP